MRADRQSEHYEHELAVAAFLWARGHRLLGVLPDPTRPAHMLFAFEHDASIAADVRDYWNGATVGARAFAQSLSELKSMLHNSRGRKTGVPQDSYA
jgi:hypothetical protein